MRKTRLVSLGFIALLVAGCYTLQPAMSGPDVGSALALDINDVGRVALGGTIGQGIGQLEGRLIGSDDGEYLIAVTSVRYLSGGEQIWGGERVRIRKEYVGNTYERRFNKGRTVALGATLAAGVAAIVISRDLFGFGSREPTPCCDSVVTLRFPRP